MKTRGPGRPKGTQGKRTPVTMQVPIDLLAEVDRAASNRTEFTIEAWREKLEREGKAEVQE